MFIFCLVCFCCFVLFVFCLFLFVRMCVGVRVCVCVSGMSKLQFQKHKDTLPNASPKPIPIYTGIVIILPTGTWELS